MNILKLSLLSTLIVLLNINSFAQTVGQDYKASMDGWEVNLEKAQAISVKTGKPILANFTGTDWCGWCIRLKKEVFVKDEFIKWANENFVLLELDFPKRFVLPDKYQATKSAVSPSFWCARIPYYMGFYDFYQCRNWEK